jgi:alpha-L-fucosidase 2
VFPAGEVNWWSPESEKKMFADTIMSLSWTGYNSSILIAGARARLSLPDTHQWITATFKERQMSNGYLMLIGGGYGKDYSGNFSEQAAAAGIVSELLMQSVGGIIRVFPAWPETINGRFANLSAEGGFLVSAEQKNGKVTQLEILSTVGGKLRFLDPSSGRIVERETRPNERIRLSP